MKRSAIVGTAAIFSALGFAMPTLAAESASVPPPASASGKQAVTGKPAEGCMSAVRAFTADMSNQGY